VSFLQQRLSFKPKNMPIITFESGQISDELQQQLIKKLTEVAVELTGTPKEYFFVTIKQHADNSMAIGGETVAQIKNKLKNK